MSERAAGSTQAGHLGPEFYLRLGEALKLATSVGSDRVVRGVRFDFKGLRSVPGGPWIGMDWGAWLSPPSLTLPAQPALWFPWMGEPDAETAAHFELARINEGDTVRAASWRIDEHGDKYTSNFDKTRLYVLVEVFHAKDASIERPNILLEYRNYLSLEFDGESFDILLERISAYTGYDKEGPLWLLMHNRSTMEEDIYQALSAAIILQMLEASDEMDTALGVGSISITMALKMGYRLGRFEQRVAMIRDAQAGDRAAEKASSRGKKSGESRRKEAEKWQAYVRERAIQVRRANSVMSRAELIRKIDRGAATDASAPALPGYESIEEYIRGLERDGTLPLSPGAVRRRKGE